MGDLFLVLPGLFWTQVKAGPDPPPDLLTCWTNSKSITNESQTRDSGTVCQNNNGYFLRSVISTVVKFLHKAFTIFVF